MGSMIGYGVLIHADKVESLDKAVLETISITDINEIVDFEVDEEYAMDDVGMDEAEELYRRIISEKYPALEVLCIKDDHLFGEGYAVFIEDSRDFLFKNGPLELDGATDEGKIQLDSFIKEFGIDGEAGWKKWLSEND